MLLLRLSIILILSIFYTNGILCQAIYFEDSKSAVAVIHVEQSLREGVVAVVDTSFDGQDSVSIIMVELDDNLEVIDSFSFPFKELPFSRVENISHYDDDNYLMLITMSSDQSNTTNNRSFGLIKLSKNFDEWSFLSLTPMNEDVIFVNPHLIKIDESIYRYYYSLYEDGLYHTYYFSIDLTNDLVSNHVQLISTPGFFIRDIEIFEEKIYVSGPNGFYVIEDDWEEMESIHIGWNSNNIFKNLKQSNFEILSNGRIIFSGSLRTSPNNSTEYHGIASFELSSLNLNIEQEEPFETFAFNDEASSVSYIQSLHRVPNTNELWSVGANVRSEDILLGVIPNKNTDIQLVKLNNQGQIDFTKIFNTDTYTFPFSGRVDENGNLYVSGYTINADVDTYFKGFVLKFNSEGELSSSVEIPLGDVLSVYPNPVSDKLYLDGIGQGRYKLMTIEGKVFETGDFDNQVIDMSHLTKGPYIVAIEQEGQIVFKKIIKE